MSFLSSISAFFSERCQNRDRGLIINTLRSSTTQLCTADGRAMNEVHLCGHDLLGDIVKTWILTGYYDNVIILPLEHVLYNVQTTVAQEKHTYVRTE